MPPERVDKLQQWLRQREVDLLFQVLEGRCLLIVDQILESMDSDSLAALRDDYRKTQDLMDLLDAISSGQEKDQEPFRYHTPSYAYTEETKDNAARLTAAGEPED